MKRILSILAAALLLCYFIFIAFVAKGEKDDAICREVTVVIKDSLDRHFLNKNDIVASLKNAKLYPVDLFISRINTDKIEKHIAKNHLLATVSVYKTPSGKVKIEVTQKMPVLRVFSADGSYYVDDWGHIMPSDFQYATYLPVASGNIEKSLATSDLYKFALFLRKHEFWNNQIEQIYVHPNKEVELVPRVGSHRIILGDFNDFEAKMDNLQLFYEQAIPRTGWEKYNIINLKYRNQIVCTKK
ncbi:MAG: cell division protein FtsQ [Tannerella sp.]|jgi:cell division protein FtsQ|nr:cell division protein FtsQ [Tannerella sp.]